MKDNIKMLINTNRAASIFFVYAFALTFNAHTMDVSKMLSADTDELEQFLDIANFMKNGNTSDQDLEKPAPINSTPALKIISSDYKLHIITDDEKNPYACRFCQFSRSRSADINQHVKTYHKEEYMEAVEFQCADCPVPRYFLNEAGAQRHRNQSSHQYKIYGNGNRTNDNNNTTDDEPTSINEKPDRTTIALWTVKTINKKLQHQCNLCARAPFTAYTNIKLHVQNNHPDDFAKFFTICKMCTKTIQIKNGTEKSHKCNVPKAKHQKLS